MMSLRAAVEVVGKAVLVAEHEHFVEFRIDNHEHIPRVARIARVVAQVLRDAHEPPAEADAVQEALLAYGKQLFMDEWMNQLGPNEDEARALDEGTAEFDRILSDG
ncbi:MAG: hypothetical protein HYT85_07825 [candidate division NC10 bacterium]|nr:hypothetical protein [candidate division NC10 bacterium]